MTKEIDIKIIGLGIILYSDYAVANILEGEDYLQKYETPEQVLSHIYKGTIVSFSTSSSGTFRLQIYNGYPDEELLDQYKFELRLGIHVKGGKVYFRDLYDLMDWEKKCPQEQILELADGFYHITLLSNLPASGKLGDKQNIEIYLNKLNKMPLLKFNGIPMLCF